MAALSIYNLLGNYSIIIWLEFVTAAEKKSFCFLLTQLVVKILLLVIFQRSESCLFTSMLNIALLSKQELNMFI